MNYITLTEKEAIAYKQYKITIWKGVDPVQIDADTWVLRPELIDKINNTVEPEDDIRDFATISKAVPIELEQKDFPTVDIDTGETIFKYVK